MDNTLEARGFAVANRVLNQEQVETLRHIVAQIEGAGVSRRASVFAIRNLLDHPAIRELACAAPIRALVEPILGANCFAVRGIFFDKTPDANWKVPFHQDLSIAVESKIEVAGFGPWSEKAGACHVQPPAALLEQMLTLRLHLDACDGRNGALRVVPGSHRMGKLDAIQIARAAAQNVEIVPVESGGAMLMRPMLLHASSAAENATHRRVIHLEFGSRILPGGLNWAHTGAKSGAKLICLLPMKSALEAAGFATRVAPLAFAPLALAPLALAWLALAPAPPARATENVPPPAMTDPKADSKAAQPAIVATLEEATQGLQMPSETDAPFEVVFFARGQGEGDLTPQNLAELAGAPAGAEIETRDLADFFVPAATIEDWMNDEEKATAGRFAALLERLKKELENPQVVVWGEAKKRVAILGGCQGGVAGVTTLVVET